MLEREIHKIRGNCAQPKRRKETAQHLWEHSGVLVQLRSILFLKKEQNRHWKWANAVLMFKSERVKDSKNYTAMSVMSMQAR